MRLFATKKKGIFYEFNKLFLYWYYDKVFAHYERLFWGALAPPFPNKSFFLVRDKYHQG